MVLSMIDAAYALLRKVGTPQHYNDIINEAINRSLISTGGLTPGASLVSAISRENTSRVRRGELPRFDAMGNGMYGLVEWRPIGIERRIQEVNQATRRELSEKLGKMPPKAFEELIGELLTAIGFETVEVKGRSGDGGIDIVGVMDVEGITRIDGAVQVKRVKSNISPDKITALRGSLLPHQRGIFITTSSFTKQSVQETNAVGKSPISLIDGEQLLDLLIQHDIGVVTQPHAIYAINAEYWPEAPAQTAPVISSDSRNAAKQVPVNYPLSIFARYRGAVIEASLLETGEVIVDGQTFSSVSSAGMAVTGWKSCNGWSFWHFINTVDNADYLLDVLRRA
jgi:restriction system protein